MWTMTCIREPNLISSGEKEEEGADYPRRLHNTVCTTDLQPLYRPLLMDLSAFRCLIMILLLHNPCLMS